MVTRTRNKSKAIDIHNHNPPRIDKMNKVDPEIRQFLDMEAQVDEGVDLEEDESARGRFVEEGLGGLVYINIK
ncbi:hypothetical protein JR316_0009342 [Psilocybe cubensis]|uniref:Uncharacterized protein n=1 Tax=Psilocybe cubensis TaxID=181762 RepID=A0ACB8GV66_PSICU|nr:hypothetical protein JR316_0009342 [Psilocybe cubensis]KAH9478880.1 hypothetical protein JR316_0009342 [Psilocybe cubensis]